MEDPLYSALLANIVFNGYLCYTTIMLNIVTIHALRKTSSLPKTLRSLLLSLAVTDLGVGLLGQPLNIAYMAELLKVQYNVANHGILTYSIQVCLNILLLSSFFTIMALSADRFLAIQKPLRYENIVTHKRVVIVIISIWLFSTLLALSIVFVVPLKITVVIFVIIYILCIVATTWASCKMYSTVRYHNVQIQLQTREVAQNSEMVNTVSLKKSAQSTLCIYLAFWLCYLPHFSILAARQIHTNHSVTLITLNEFSLTLIFLNSSLNPVIYCWTMRHIRHTVKDILRNIFRR